LDLDSKLSSFSVITEASKSEEFVEFGPELALLPLELRLISEPSEFTRPVPGVAVRGDFWEDFLGNYHN
jgi:hypothetical protein